jgi:hypothetical protein
VAFVGYLRAGLLASLVDKGQDWRAGNFPAISATVTRELRGELSRNEIYKRSHAMALARSDSLVSSEQEAEAHMHMHA